MSAESTHRRCWNRLLWAQYDGRILIPRGSYARKIHLTSFDGSAQPLLAAH